MGKESGPQSPADRTGFARGGDAAGVGEGAAPHAWRSAIRFGQPRGGHPVPPGSLSDYGDRRAAAAREREQKERAEKATATAEEEKQAALTNLVSSRARTALAESLRNLDI